MILRTLSYLLLSLLLITLNAPDTAAQRRKKKSRKAKTTALQLQPWEIDTLIHPIPINRQAFTDKIQQEVRKADLRDGAVDGLIELEDKAVSAMLTEVLLKEVPLLLIHIENLPQATHQTKISYHRTLGNLMQRLNAKSFQSGDLSYFRKIVHNVEEIIVAREQNTLKEYLKDNANVYTLDNSDLLNDFPQEKAYVFETVGLKKPEIMIKRLPEFAREAYADRIVATAAKVVPGTILTYATSTSYLSSVVRRNPDPLVQSIVRIASESQNPLKVLPFLGEIHNKSKTVRQMDAITNNPVEYYKALVRLKVKDEAIARDYIDKELNLRGLQFVRKVNELHDYGAAVRFKSLAPFNEEDLYFMMIGSQDEIYTSSFTWMFHRMMEQMKPLSGDQLLEKVHKDHFRTFIRMCAGYNTLAPFLASIEGNRKELLMKEFVANLEQGDEEDLTDAVDVADAFGSITDPQLVAFLKNEIKSNYERTYKANNQQSHKGVIVYGLLSTIFNSADQAEGLSNNLSDLIPPITYVPYASLVDAKGNIVIQTFFYGDEDGRISFSSFKSNFPANKWESQANKNWIKYTSKGPHSIIVYANLPLTEPKDEEAQKALADHLEQQNIHPSLVIHRGHSYHLGGSLANLDPEVKVVMLGSCGGYHNLASVLDKSPDAHIISSKQVGSFSVNEPIIKEILGQLTQGKDLNWLQAWGNLNTYFSKRGKDEKDLFSDYIPPNKNLGAIFIKAYRKQLMLDDEG